MPLFFDTWLSGVGQSDPLLLGDMDTFPDYPLLLPRCSAFVHHGSSTTAAAGLEAGLPHVVLPVTADQTAMVSFFI